MNNQKILDMLKENKIEELKQLLENEILLEPVKNTSRKTAYKNVIKQLKKVKNVVLQHCLYSNDYQYFTNTYWAFKCNKNNYNPLIPEINENKYYPDIEKIFNDTTAYCFSVATFKAEDLLNKIRECKTFNNKNNKELKLNLNNTCRWVNYDYLELIINYMYDKNDEVIIHYSDGAYRPLVFSKNEDDTKALLCVLNIKENER